jgi:hypothetical protein
VQAVCALVAIAMVHSDDRLASIIAMGVFATGVATSILLIASHDRPFMGQVSVGPDPLLQVMPLGEDRLSGRGVAERLSTKEKTSLGDDHVARAESTQDGVWSHPSGVPAGPAAG